MISIFKLSGIESKVSEKKISENYEQWREFSKESKENFYILPSGLKKYLSFFDGKALNLYLYYCLHSKNETGESWHSTKKCADSLNVTERSINNWNKILEEIGLIKRTSTDKLSKSTFLLPISDFIVFEKRLSVDEFLKDYFKSEYQRDLVGELVSIFNLYQWRKNMESNEYTDKYNVMCLVFERNHSPSKADVSFRVRKFVFISENLIDQTLKTVANDIKDDVYRIEDKNIILEIFRESSITISNDVTVENMIINTKYNLKDFHKGRILELLNHLCDNRNQLGEMNIVE